MSKSQRNSPRQKKKFKLFKHHSNDGHYANPEPKSKSSKQMKFKKKYHNQQQPQTHSPFPSLPPTQSSHPSQTFPQQNNHNYYNNHDPNNHKSAPYIASPHHPHHQYQTHNSSPYTSIDENQPLHHTQQHQHQHQSPHQSHSGAHNAQSPPNIHHTNRYSQEMHHNRNGHPPKHHSHRGHMGTNGKNTTSTTPTQQLKQSSNTKSNIFNHYPPHNIPQSPYNRQHYVVNSPPQQHPTKPFGNTFNTPTRGRTRSNTYHSGQQPPPHMNHSPHTHFGEEMIEYPKTFRQNTRQKRSNTINTYPSNHQPSHSQHSLSASNHYTTTMSNISPGYSPTMGSHHHNGNFNNFALSPSNRSRNSGNSPNPGPIPQYSPNIAPTMSLDQFYNNKNTKHYANSHEARYRQRFHSDPHASPIDGDAVAVAPIHISKHKKHETHYHIHDMVFDRSPSTDSSCCSLDDDLRGLHDYHMQLQQEQMLKPKRNNGKRKRKKRKDPYKEEKKKTKTTKTTTKTKKKKKKKGRQAIWGHRKQETNKYFVKKSSHKKIVGTAFEYKKSDQTKKFLRKRIQQELLFENLPSDMIRKMVQKMYRVDIAAKQNVVCCGDAADAYFVIEKGGLEIWKYPTRGTPDGDGDRDTPGRDSDHIDDTLEPILKDTLECGDTFGDNALLYATTHQYTYRAQSKPIMDMYDSYDSDTNDNFIGCRCWALSQETFDQIRKKQASSRLESSSKLIKFIKSIDMFKDLESADLQEISDAMMRITYRKRDKIVCEGDSSTHFFIIYRGTCDAVKKADMNNILKSYGIADCFGELGIMKNQSRAATVIVTSDQLIAYALPALDFKSLLDYDVVAQSMHKKINQYLAIPDDCKSFENRVQCALSDFKEIGCLGVGAFGRVILVETPSDNSVYALKKVRKNRIVETSQQEHIINEKRIMAALDCVFCIKLFATFKDELNVYFLLEPVMGGELFSLLRHEKRLKQRTATFYCACVVLAFDYLHTKLNVIYRDLKPENLLIDTNGYCKLVDFGFAKKRNNTCTLCGTPQYLAPEVIQNFAHGFAVDWWSVGILIYEMIFGYPPFEGDKNMKMYEKILTAPVEFPENPPIRSYTKDIINSLLRKQAHKRLGAGTKGAESIKKHSFFKRIDWKKMSKQEIDPPWKPKIRGPHDLSAFDRFPDTTPENEKLVEDPDGVLFKWCDEF